MKQSANRSIVIMAGGTGGHIFPGIAVAEQLQKKGWEIHWLGTADRMEAQIVPRHGFTLHYLTVTGIRGRGLLAKLNALKVLVSAICHAKSLLKALNPTLVLGMGGYASGPGGIAAKWLGIPLIIHEQNAVMGMTNRWLARIANKVMLGFTVAKQEWATNEKVVVTGNPIRQTILGIPHKAKEDIHSDLRVLIVGGSLGARPFNELLPTILSKVDGLEIYHQAGANNIDAVIDEYKKQGLSTGAKLQVYDFIEDMSAAYAWADVVICRAGAITVTEIALAGMAAIFIPLPHAVDDHQTKNAKSLVDRRAGFLVKQEDMTLSLPKVFDDLKSDPAQLQTIRLNALDCAISTGTNDVVSICEAISEECQ